MKLNDARMLPKISLQMENVQDLLNSESKEIDRVKELLTEKINQLFISTATYGLDRYETILGLTTDTKLDRTERISRIVAKMLGQGTVNSKLIKNVADSFTNGEVDIIEYPKESRFEVVFTSVIGIPTKIEDLTAAINEIKPAHLLFSYIYRYLRIEEIHDIMTIEQLQEQPLEKFAFGG